MIQCFVSDRGNGARDGDLCGEVGIPTEIANLRVEREVSDTALFSAVWTVAFRQFGKPRVSHVFIIPLQKGVVKQNWRGRGIQASSDASEPSPLFGSLAERLARLGGFEPPTTLLNTAHTIIGFMPFVMGDVILLKLSGCAFKRAQVW